MRIAAASSLLMNVSRLGPILPVEPACASTWHAPQPALAKTALPASVLGAAGGAWLPDGVVALGPVTLVANLSRSAAAALLAAVMRAFWATIQAWYCSTDTTRTWANMFAWPRPQSSAHWPR